MKLQIKLNYLQRNSARRRAFLISARSFRIRSAKTFPPVRILSCGSNTDSLAQLTKLITQPIRSSNIHYMNPEMKLFLPFFLLYGIIPHTVSEGIFLHSTKPMYNTLRVIVRWLRVRVKACLSKDATRLNINTKK